MAARLKSRLPEIALELEPRVDAALRATAESIEDTAKTRVPVDTGTLRDAIHVEDSGELEYSVVAGDTQAFYGHIVEHGSTNTPPQPFLIPAAELGRAAAEAFVREALRGL
jgi:HK97 gp10 family phage protein